MSGSALACAGLTKAFKDRRVLDGVSLDVRPGEVHAVLGPSGAGKTTLLRILNLLEPCDAGAVTFDGESIGLRAPHERLTVPQHRARLKMALVPQKPVAFRRSVFDNAAFGLRVRGVEAPEVERRVDEQLTRLGIAAHKGAPARRLSGGEQQRLAFARAAVLDIEFLLLDEFTANLDPRNVQILEQAARGFAAGGGGVLLVTHDLFQTRRIADRVSLLVEGRIVESAPRAQFFESPQDERARAFVAGELAL